MVLLLQVQRYCGKNSRLISQQRKLSYILRNNIRWGDLCGLKNVRFTTSINKNLSVSFCREVTLHDIYLYMNNLEYISLIERYCERMRTIRAVYMTYENVFNDYHKNWCQRVSERKLAICYSLLHERYIAYFKCFWIE